MTTTVTSQPPAARRGLTPQTTAPTPAQASPAETPTPTGRPAQGAVPGPAQGAAPGVDVARRNAARQRMVGGPAPATAAPAPGTLRDVVAGQVQALLDRHGQSLDGALDGALGDARSANAAAAKAKPEAYAVADKLIQAAIDEATKSWSPADKQALDRVMGTLDQLAGPDGKLNFGDKQAITRSILADRSGIMRMVHQQIDIHVPGLGNNLAHRVADNSQRNTRRFQRTGRRGPIQRVREKVRGRINAEARNAISRELNKALSQVKVDPATARKIDGGARHLSVQQMLQLGQDVQRLQQKVAEGGAVAGRAADGSARPSSGDLAERVHGILTEAGVQVDPPLREGIPSLRRPDAVVDTLLGALQGISLR